MILARYVAAAALALSLVPALAQADTALLIGNANYDDAARIRGAQSITSAGPALLDAGFDVTQGTDLTIDEIRAAFSELLTAGEDRRLIIALSGHFSHSADGEVWFLGTDAEAPNRADIGSHGVALSTIYALASTAPGRSVVLLGTEPRAIDLGPGLAAGLQVPEPPQGVTVISGAPRVITRVASFALTRPGLSLPEVLEGIQGLETQGFLSRSVAFLEAEPESAVDAPGIPVFPAAISTAERNLWDAVQELDTEGAYINYLTQYPTGSFVREARARLDTLQNTPPSAEEIEAALSLNRADRRAIQSDLTVLGFNTNGIDGIFGGGTRAAIRGFQSANDLDVTGYLDRGLLQVLADQATLRRAQIEAEEAAARAERDRLDRAYWTATGQGRTEAGLRAYVTRYPNGLFADIANARLGDIDAAADAAAAAEEQAAWDFARSQDTVPAYRGYLAAHPDGSHAREAQTRIAILSGEPAPVDEDAQAQLAAREAALNLPGITRLLIERRLDDGGYEPGRADGVFDDQARAAIAAFQGDEGLPQTGYLDQPTIARMLSNGIRVIVQ
ncbi:MAG: peptidoglycan-binding protein [Pseudomonadota bacterium]